MHRVTKTLHIRLKTTTKVCQLEDKSTLIINQFNIKLSWVFNIIKHTRIKNKQKFIQNKNASKQFNKCYNIAMWGRSSKVFMVSGDEKETKLIFIRYFYIMKS